MIRLYATQIKRSMTQVLHSPSHQGISHFAFNPNHTPSKGSRCREDFLAALSSLKGCNFPALRVNNGKQLENKKRRLLGSIHRTQTFWDKR